MKIDAGVLKNFQVEVINETRLRPTKSRIRISLFDVLTSRISFSDYVFFDLFSGSGAVGIEALNRGFKKSFFFENNPRVFSTLKKTLTRLPEEFAFELHFGDASSSFQNLSDEKKEQKKVFFIDAPFRLNLEDGWLDLLQKEKDCILIIEKDEDLRLSLEKKKQDLICFKKYGKIYLHFLKF